MSVVPPPSKRKHCDTTTTKTTPTAPNMPVPLLDQVRAMKATDKDVIASVLAKASVGLGGDIPTPEHLATMVQSFLAASLGIYGGGFVMVRGRRVFAPEISAQLLELLVHFDGYTVEDYLEDDEDDDNGGGNDNGDNGGGNGDNGNDNGDNGGGGEKASNQKCGKQKWGTAQAKASDYVMMIDARMKSKEADSGAAGRGRGAPSGPKMSAVFNELQWILVPLFALLRNDAVAFGGALQLPEGDNDIPHRHLPIAFGFFRRALVDHADHAPMIQQLERAARFFFKSVVDATHNACAYTGDDAVVFPPVVWDAI